MQILICLIHIEYFKIRCYRSRRSNLNILCTDDFTVPNRVKRFVRTFTQKKGPCILTALGGGESFISTIYQKLLNYELLWALLVPAIERLRAKSENMVPESANKVEETGEYLLSSRVTKFCISWVKKTSILLTYLLILMSQNVQSLCGIKSLQSVGLLKIWSNCYQLKLKTIATLFVFF